MAVTLQATPFVSSFNKTTPVSQVAAQVAMGAGVAETWTVPGDANKNYTAVFGYNGASNVFVGFNTTAAVPGAGTVTTLTQVELCPDKRYVIGGDVLTFITPDTTAYLSVSLLAIPNK